ncbi:MAG: type III polyketide synthase [Anaerolineae bacterium]|nr:type III polyketide synthase [Anaerolineae bacterium]
MDKTPVISAIEAVFPPHYYPQQQLTDMLREQFWKGSAQRQSRYEQLHRNVSVEGRYLALPLDAYTSLDGFRGRNDAWIDVATALGEEALTCVLHRANLRPQDAALLATTTVTGVAVPTLDARLMNRLAFAPDLKRLPLFGLGCLGGVAGVARVADYLRGHPQEAALLLAVELCSLTLQPDDLSIANIIATGLFGDGAAGVLLAGAGHPLAAAPAVQIVASRSLFFPDTERVMGWDVTDSGFQVVLSADVPELARTQIGPAVDSFLAAYGLARDDMAHWVAHPGGPKVIEALEASLALPPGTLHLSRESLARVGNLSSVSVLLILRETLRQQPRPGSYGLMIAMGPAFAAELVLLRFGENHDTK